jgi:restriction system protein
MDIVFHYPPELFQLLGDTIPRLCRSKEDVLTFFQGAGVPATFTADFAAALRRDRESVKKFPMTKTILTRLNEQGERTLGERRSVLRRVVEFEDFSTCWPEDELKAKGLVSEVRRVVNVKDSFTRLDNERDAERRKRREIQQAEERKLQAARTRLKGVRQDLLALFNETDPQKRGKALEGVLNRLFKESGVLVTEAFTVCGEHGEGVVEQIDGLIEFEGQHYLVEMKWWNKPLGVPEVSTHFARIFFRGQARGILISASGYGEPALAISREALQKTVIVLAGLDEIVLLLEREVDLRPWLKEKISAAIGLKNPFHRSVLLS